MIKLFGHHPLDTVMGMVRAAFRTSPEGRCRGPGTVEPTFVEDLCRICYSLVSVQPMMLGVYGVKYFLWASKASSML